MKTLPSEIICALALNSLYQVSLTQKRSLITELGSFQNIFSTFPEKISQIESMTPTVLKAITHFSDFEKSEREFRMLKQLDISIIPFTHKDYPHNLRNLVDAPQVLYVKGNAELLQMLSLAVVGSRKASFYGLSVTSQLVPELVKANIAIVSGGARGIDTEAHKSALKALGKTIVVLGCGLDVCYPTENKKLFDQIEKEGCIVSEFPLKTPPYKINFPQRNRIISGLSQGTLVVEASLKSGSLITAKMALEQGKEVFAIPGSILSYHYSGTNKLLQDGACLVQSIHDILWELGIDNKVQNSYSQKRFSFLKELTDEEKKILSTLSEEGHSLNEIEQMTELDIELIHETLTHMQLEGYVKELPGKKFVRAEEAGA
ncbi:MAG: DNA-protecting protein DprA [Deltaproteobacteria bacterium]|nr:DNA-protecting protein DprA [Deltaproteobacteria bacterium]